MPPFFLAPVFTTTLYTTPVGNNLNYFFNFFSQEGGSEHNQTFLSLTIVTVTCVQCVDAYGKGNYYKSDSRELKITRVVYKCSLTFGPYNEKM